MLYHAGRQPNIEAVRLSTFHLVNAFQRDRHALRFVIDQWSVDTLGVPRKLQLFGRERLGLRNAVCRRLHLPSLATIEDTKGTAFHSLNCEVRLVRAFQLHDKRKVRLRSCALDSSRPRHRLHFAPCLRPAPRRDVFLDDLSRA